MEPSDDVGELNPVMEDVCSPHGSAGQQDSLPDMLRIKQQMSNQCFEMAIHLHAGKSKRSCSTSEAKKNLPYIISELERVKTVHFNQTLTLHRMQMWHAIREKLKQGDAQAGVLKTGIDRCRTFSLHIKQLQQESRNLQNEITEIQKKRLEMKRLMLEKMKQMEELMLKKEHPDAEKYKATLEKGQENLQKHKKIAIMTQNVLRGILLACKINWMDDPKLRDIATTLEELPISD